MTYGLDVQQLRELVIRPALQHIGLWSQAAENLVLGTALVESGLRALKQQPGPALGLWQMEPRTYTDHVLNMPSAMWLKVQKLRDMTTEFRGGEHELVGNLWYAAAMCRVHYYRKPKPLPQHSNAQGMAETWKRDYNTARGKGTILKALPHFVHACA